MATSVAPRAKTGGEFFIDPDTGRTSVTWKVGTNIVIVAYPQGRGFPAPTHRAHYSWCEGASAETWSGYTCAGAHSGLRKARLDPRRAQASEVRRGRALARGRPNAQPRADPRDGAVIGRALNAQARSPA